VGRVQDIQLSGTEARIRFAVFNDVEMRGDASISRRASSLLGTSVLSLDPGTELSPVIPSGSVISTAPPSVDMDVALGMVQDIGGQVILILEEFRTNQMVLLAASLEAFTSIAQTVDAQSDVQFDRISRILESTALLTESAERILRTSEGNITGSFSGMHEALANIRSITGEIASGRGNLGMAVHDERLYSSVLAAVQRVEGAVGQLEETLGDFSSVAKNVDGVVTNAGEIVERALGLGVMIDTNARYDFNANTARASASLRLEPMSNDRWYRIGVSSSPDGVTSRTRTETTDLLPGGGVIVNEETTKTNYRFTIDAELARRIGAFTLRGGLLESTAGFGMDLQVFDWMSLSGELFDFSNGDQPNLRGTVTFYPFFDPDSNKPWNWLYLRAGINNSLSGDRDFFLGGGLRFFDREVRGLVGLATIFN
jgi:phospholipid/cholesterol/gamma-HCH transport system substrate-binding protein